METEVKIRIADRAKVEERLTQAGFRICEPRQRETNDVYDTPDHSLRRREMLLRLRQFGEKSVITWKGPAEPGPQPGGAGRHKNRPELETTLGSLDTLAAIFEQLGYRRTFRYEKYRTEYANGQVSGVVTVDETPIGDFLEIEGPGDWIDATAARLGFSKQDYVLSSYGQLYLEECRRRGVEARNMVFAAREDEVQWQEL